ncbi:DUF6519 domain-containing protein [Sphingomonas sp. SUN039]|uniref:DUF6519 domain-containing protein n=1 Tax=Sphingomonas sp. SUN039 TaxID=2937787 RepID=UPI00216413D3|nr:DUF6519 domain-containing protein [Sphingomonas sp. SUN039]UVO55689.1 DUF6519 domain-containing protein [Sphingomonas sp. SUN039]
MTGDFSRNTFDPAKGYSAVRMQQGRLFTDADWNEEGDIARHAERSTTRAVIGASGFPETDPGFAIQPGAGAAALLVGTGEAFLDGIRIVNAPGPAISLERASGAGANTQWKVTAGERLAVGHYLVLAGNSPAQAVRVSELLADDAAGLQLVKCAAALSANNQVSAVRWYSVESQPHFPSQAMPAQAAQYLVYLDVWERPVGAIEDPAIRETAFGGPDTAMRDKLLWQVRIAAVADLIASGAAAQPVSCKSFGPDWTPFGPGPRGRLAARSTTVQLGGDPCVLPAIGGYRRLDNHLYRVEVHNGGTIASGKVRLKWSIDNASHRSAYSAIDSGKIVVDTLGPDEVTSLQRQDWIEILDEARVLSGKGGFFGRISDVNGTRLSLDKLLDPDTLLELTANGAPDTTLLPSKGIVRRWEGGQPVAVANANWLALEPGVEVQLAEGRFATGDYWTIPARSLVADIEWPRDSATGGPALRLPQGIQHHYSALGLATLAGASWTVTDCRPPFAPLTLQRSFLYLGGDGQEAMPQPANTANLTALASPLRVGVVRGKTPVAGAKVEFRVTTGTGKVGDGVQNLTVLQVATGADGVASVTWSLDAATQTQRVEARLLDAAGTPTHLPIQFSASISRASQVSFDPANVPALAGADTVQEAIEKLVALKEAGCSTYVVVEGSDWVALLKAIKPGENAAICFQRGRFATAEQVDLEGLGHITLHGAGSGTTIVATKGECAIRFSKCASISVREIAFSAPDGGEVNWRPGIRPQRMGALTVLDCPVVTISDAEFTCGGSATPERTCLTVRGSAKAPLKSVGILRNRMIAGYGQDGVLVTDAARCLIEDNEIDIAPRSRRLSFERLLGARFWRAKLLDQLISGVKEGGLVIGDNIRTIAAGPFIATFRSTVPQREWSLLLKKRPLGPAARTAMADFQTAVRALLEAVTDDPTLLASFERTVRRLENAGGNTNPLGRDVKRALVVADDVQFGRKDRAERGDAGKVSVSVGQVGLVFDSVVDQQDWRSAMAIVPPKKPPTDAAELGNHLRRLAVRMIADVKFRDRLPSAKNWFTGFAKALPSFGRQAITCGGGVLDDVTVTGNITSGFVRGVHIGTSVDTRNTVVSAGRVTVSRNHLACRKPAEKVYAGCALFVGNADTVRIERNNIDWFATPMKNRYAQGIRVWGKLGRYLVVAENRIEVASLGIRIKPSDPVDDGLWKRYLWLVADNLVDGVDPALVMRVPPWTEKRFNRPS